MNTLTSPRYYRSRSVFDRFNDFVQTAMESQEANSPAYDIEKVSDNEYTVTLSVPGYPRDKLSIEVRDGWLVIDGEPSAQENRQFVYRGIRKSAFSRRFKLGQYVEVDGASLDDGLLTVRLKQIVPDSLKPRTVAISGGNTGEEARIESAGSAE